MSPPPSWGNPSPEQPEPDGTHPERYIFLILSLIFFVWFLKKIQEYRPQERFDPALDELDVEAAPNTEEGQWNVAGDGALYWDDDSGVAVSTTPGATYTINRLLTDDTYQAVVSSFVSLESEGHASTDTFNVAFDCESRTPEHHIRTSDAQRIQYLVAKLRTALYAARNELEGSPSRREVEMLRRHITDMAVVIGNSDYASRPPSDLMEPPPPPYSDVVQGDGNHSLHPTLPPSSTRPTPPRLIIP